MPLESLLSYSYALWHGGSNLRAYDERAFRYFLSVERKRAEESNRSVLVALVSLDGTAALTPPLSPVSAIRMFLGLADCVREVDFLGWYRQGYVIGAVLAQGAVPGVDVLSCVEERVRRAVCDRLPLPLRDRVRVRVVRFSRDGRR